jgi:hypothetical protein
MIEVLVFLALVLLVFVILLGLSVWREKNSINSLNEKVSSLNQQILIAQRRFMQGKIKKPVFELILEDLESELYSTELMLFRSQKSSSISVKPKTDEIMSKLDKPTKHRRQLVESILSETELIREELALLEAKLFKHEIKQSVFDKLVRKKESELIRKEKELMDVVLNATASDKPSVREKISDEKISS